MEPIISLKCAERDARELAALFKYELGYQAEYLEGSTVDDIQSSIARLADKLQAGDTFIFYFSGHGKSHKDDQYFLLKGCDYDVLEQGCAITAGVLSWDTLKKLTSKAKWQGVQRVFIFDACRTPLITTKGDTNNSSFDGEYLFRSAFGKRRSKEEATEVPLTLINSCADEKCSIELPATGHGVFTEALMEWFMDVSKLGNGIILNDHFIDDVARRMRTLVEENKRAYLGQTPVLHGTVAHLELRDITTPKARDERKWRAVCLSNTIEAYSAYCAQAGQEASYVDEATARIKRLRDDFKQNIAQKTQPGMKPLIKPEPEIIYPSNPSNKTSKYRRSQSFQGKVMLEMVGGAKNELALNHELLIGRAQTNAIRTNDEQTSRVHARLYLAGGKVMLCDQGSCNGTYLNDALISNPVAIGDGDCIRVGKTKIKVYF
jgi:hypothetical protein